jgi:DNA-binding XRE family transcriptional regulator
MTDADRVAREFLLTARPDDPVVRALVAEHGAPQTTELLPARPGTAWEPDATDASGRSPREHLRLIIPGDDARPPTLYTWRRGPLGVWARRGSPQRPHTPLSRRPRWHGHRPRCRGRPTARVDTVSEPLTAADRMGLAEVGMRVRPGRVAHRQSQEQLAAESGVSRVTIGSIERATTRPPSSATTGSRGRSFWRLPACWTVHRDRAARIGAGQPAGPVSVCRVWSESRRARPSDVASAAPTSASTRPPAFPLSVSRPVH